MLYIHALNHLTPKTADLESVYLMREIKQKIRYPLLPDKLHEHFFSFFVSETDIKYVENALQLLEPTEDTIKSLLSRHDSLHEPINLQRALQILKEMPAPLNRNLQYIKEIDSWQNNFAAEITPVLNKIPQLKTPQEKLFYNEKLNKIFQTLLRNDKLVFNAQDIIYEAQLNHIVGLSESLEKGFLFHTTLEETIKKTGFEAVRSRLPQERIEEIELIQKNVNQIKKGVERAYEFNLRMVNWAVILYSYVKWMLAGGN